VNVNTETRVVGQIIAYVIRIGVNDNLVGIPKPPIAIGDIKGRYAPVEVVEPETAWTASC
jgi:hypothetical protein